MPLFLSISIAESLYIPVILGTILETVVVSLWVVVSENVVVVTSVIVVVSDVEVSDNTEFSFLLLKAKK